MSSHPSSEPFEQHRHCLLGIGYRMLGSLADAEDIVQEAYLRWHTAEGATAVQDARAYLTRIVVRLCLDRMKSAQVRRETYIGPWLPEPLVGSSPFAQEVSPTSLAEDISFALFLILERLSPLERAAFLLHDVFDLNFQEVARVLERSEASCRQLAARARKHVRAARPRFRPSKGDCERLTSVFIQAAGSGNPAELSALLAEDCSFLSDGGGRVPAAIRPVLGRDNVVRLIMGLSAKYKDLPNVQYELATINGLPGVVSYQPSGPLHTLALETREDGKITAIYVVNNPEKLRHLASALRSTIQRVAGWTDKSDRLRPSSQ